MSDEEADAGLRSTKRRSTVQRIGQVIRDQCVDLVTSDGFTEWRADEKLDPGDLVLCNNSFLFREGTTTTKSSMYLGFETAGRSRVGPRPRVITVTRGFNSQFRRVRVRQPRDHREVALQTAVQRELPRVGWVVLSLVGQIGEPEAAEVTIDDVAGIRALRYTPGLQEVVLMDQDVLSLQRVDDLGAVWQAATALLDGGPIDLERLGREFEPAFKALREMAMRPVDASLISEGEPSILSEIAHRMTGQIGEYRSALAQHRGDPRDLEAYNELLRIAYNFADGARAFIGLMVGICDLKPLISWMTIAAQVQLADRFAKLPLYVAGQGKPSLARYRSVIANARNQAFHDVFAFDHPLRVRLPGDALRMPELHLFRAYSRRGDAALNYEDRAVVELLEGLTRTPVETLPAGFWGANEKAMEGVVDLVRALGRSLMVAGGAGGAG